MTILFISRFNVEYLIFKTWQGLEILVGSISSFSSGKDSRGTKGGHWTERSKGSGWSDSGTPYSLFFAKQKATQRIKIKIRNLTFVLVVKILKTGIKIVGLLKSFYKHAVTIRKKSVFVLNSDIISI